MDPITNYLKKIEKALQAGTATEHTHRPALKALIEALGKKVTATNEPKRVKCGAPDFIVTRGQTPLGYIEAKDVGKSLDAIEADARKKKPSTHDGDQLKRFLESLGNLILTDYLEFRWYEGGKFRMAARLARVGTKGNLRKEKDGTEAFSNLINAFFVTTIPTISGPKDLANRMAVLARLIRDIIQRTFQDEDKGGSLHGQLEGFRKVLLHDLKLDGFADMYAQTICYGLFAARCNHTGREPFTRERAAYEIPKTNPFLREMFGYIAGPDLDERVTWAVDDLAELLYRADIASILENFGKRTRREDPVVHFYETFLAAYNPKMRDSRGVYYTPEPVVSYIVRSIDHILKKDFGLQDGLADCSRIPFYRTVHDIGGKPHKEKAGECHKVLILDPAVGTGTFLYTVIDQIHEHLEKKGQAGMWSGYVSKHLLPRLFGFELLMAPYAVVHMKLSLQLAESGYDFASGERLRVYLTNALEEFFEFFELPPFASKIAEEANAAGNVKSETPVMVILGNPPYSGHSQTPSERIVEIMPGQTYKVKTKKGWRLKTAAKRIRRKEKTFIGDLIQDYFQVDGEPLHERNPKWLNDDYVKFIRFAQWRIEQTGYGILAFITNHSYLDNPTFRGMRQCLMQAFDEIHILDLHGNAKKREVCPDGSKDENVFDIQQGVAIGIFVKHPAEARKRAHCVKHADVWGLREVLERDATGQSRLIGGKYHWLYENAVKTGKWTSINPQSPYYLFVPQDTGLLNEYVQGWKLPEIMPVNSVGIVTARDKLTIHWDEKSVWDTVTDFIRLSPEEARERYQLGPDARDWKVSFAQQDLKESGPDKKKICPILYRPFDTRFTYYTSKSRGFICMPRPEVMGHMTIGSNLMFITNRQTRIEFNHVLMSRHVVDFHLLETAHASLYAFPIYLYPKHEKDDFLDFDRPIAKDWRQPNLAPEFIEELSRRLGLTFIPDGKGNSKKAFGPENVFNYMYAVFHSPAYRSRYAEFLKFDFPRLPLTSKPALFRDLCALGEELVGLHLMEKHAPIFTKYTVAGDNRVEKVRYTEPGQGAPAGRVWINKEQYFDNVPPEVWEFHIGGYQVCEKCLKDRKGRQLSYDDLTHYQHIVSALSETIRIMAEIDKTIDKHGGWPIK